MTKNEIETLTFKSRINIQVRMTDIDPLGHVNNGIYFSYYDTGRLNYWKQLGEDISWEAIDKVIVHLKCDFIESILFNDSIRVETKVTEIGNKSFKMMQRIVDNNTGRLKSTCLSILSGCDRQNNVSIPIPEQFRKRVGDFENNPDYHHNSL
ncbi:MAG: acyl-CoA thioesterase [Bacteroidales bacterium]|jgi:acyl-CoA thioester hydrolase|nr:acyl-CoA thioesterase [Bacteroidales bacterium]